MRKLVLVALLPLAAGGCVRTVATVVTAPVRVTSKVVDWTTTSQSEADRNYGRKMRKEEAREGRERREWAKKCKGYESRPECDHYTGYRAGS